MVKANVVGLGLLVVMSGSVVRHDRSVQPPMPGAPIAPSLTKSCIKVRGGCHESIFYFRADSA